ncbi:MAG: hypothetical protein DWQ34_06295 [Planctomycetota bacterium]|nr:MAG: hypothetical protein DWQ34_06295 [Planctomycetota bacterium]REK24245.1 MAG: hypothetical protein DWQ41_14525 [Planctomycetota bacterium]REK28770.1 MAG: hypothetical protein DWQ45_23995 [Planctomycetota bacterium]
MWHHRGHAGRTVTESGSGVGLHVNFVDGSVSHFSEASGEGDADVTGDYEYDYSRFIDRPVNDEDYDYSSTRDVVSHDEYDDIQYSETNVASDGTILFNAMDFSTTVSGWRTTHDTWTVDGVTNNHVPNPETYGPTVLGMQQGFAPNAYFKQVTTYQTDPPPDDADFTSVDEFWLLSNTEMVQYGWEQAVAMAYSGDLEVG